MKSFEKIELSIGTRGLKLIKFLDGINPPYELRRGKFVTILTEDEFKALPDFIQEMNTLDKLSNNTVSES